MKRNMEKTLEIERERYILDKIKTAGSVQVDALAKELDVSAMTIRRDLTSLKTRGLINRCHGGAIIKQETPYYNKKVSNAAEKCRIANAAIKFINSNDTVFLDAGTTTYQIAQLIADREDVTVITDDLQIAMMLSQSRTNVYVCGGYIQKTTGCVMGMFAEQIIENFLIDAAFIGTAAIDEDFTVRTPTLEKVALKRKIVENSDRSYLVADRGKFDKRATIKINTLADYTGVITDKKFTEKELTALRKKRINVIAV